MSLFEDLTNAFRPLPAGHLTMQAFLYKARGAVITAKHAINEADPSHLSVALQERFEALVVKCAELEEEITQLSDQAEEEVTSG